MFHFFKNRQQPSQPWQKQRNEEINTIIRRSASETVPLEYEQKTCRYRELPGGIEGWDRKTHIDGVNKPMKQYIALLTPSQYNESDLHRNTYQIARFLLIHSSTATEIFFILIMILLLLIIIIITTSCHLFCNKNVKIYNSMIAGQELFDEYQNSYVSKKLSFYFVFYLQPPQFLPTETDDCWIGGGFH